MLDTQGAAALTFRALALRLKTGSGAIYWHVANKEALLAAATDCVVEQAMLKKVEAASALEAICAIALQIFDALDQHPWAGTQLAGNPWQYAVLRILEGVGSQVAALGVGDDACFNAATALLSFILGLAGQYAVGSRHFAPGTDRATFLREIAADWEALDPDAHPFIHRMAAQLREHDDREQFSAGIGLILGGIDCGARVRPA